MQEVKDRVWPFESQISKSQEMPDIVYSNSRFNFYKKNKITKDDDGKVMQLEHHLKWVIGWLVSTWQQIYRPTLAQAEKDYQMYTWDRAVQLRDVGQPWRSNECIPIVRTYVDTMHANFFWQDYSLNCYARSEKKKDKAKMMQEFGKWWFASAQSLQTAVESLLDAINVWQWFWRTGFNVTPDLIRILKNQKKLEAEGKEVKHYEIEEAYPTMEYTHWTNLFYEPFLPFYKQRFVVWRKIMPFQDMVERYRPFFKLDDDQKNLILNHAKPFSLQNYEKIKLIKYYQNLLSTSALYTEVDFYKIAFNNRLVEVVEYWEKKNLVIMVNGYICYDYVNPLPTNNHPFKIIQYTRRGWCSIWDGVGTILSGLQMMQNALYNMVFDLAKMRAAPMFLLSPGQYIEGMNGTTFKYEPWAFKQIVWPGKIETFNLPSPDMDAFKVSQDIMNMADRVIGPGSYSQYDTQSRVSSDAQFKFQSLKDRIKWLADSLNIAFTSTVKDWVAIARDNMPSKFVVYTFDRKKAQTFTKISLQDLKGNYDFEFEFEWVKWLEQNQKFNNLLQFIQLATKIGTDPTTGAFYPKVKELLEEWAWLLWLDDVVRSLKEYESDVISGQEMKLDIQKELQEYMKKMQWASGIPQQQGQSPMPGATDVQSIM